MEFVRRALGHYLSHLGAEEAAALFTDAGRNQRVMGVEIRRASRQHGGRDAPS